MRIAKVVVVDRSVSTDSKFGGEVIAIYALDAQGAAKTVFPKDAPIHSSRFAENQITKERVSATDGPRFLLTLLADSSVNSGYCFAYPVDENEKPMRYAVSAKTGRVQLTDV